LDTTAGYRRAEALARKQGRETLPEIAKSAAHELDENSETDAWQLHVFAQMFLTCAFTLPQMLKRAKSETA
jgi:hypothetical protein